MPYFLRPKIVEHMPRMRMTDMMCHYETHRQFGKEQHGDVRLFADVPADRIVLKGAQYRWVR